MYLLCILSALPLHKLYLILGLGSPSAAHFNVTLAPSSAVKLAGTIVITGEDQLGAEVVESSSVTVVSITGA